MEEMMANMEASGMGGLSMYVGHCHSPPTTTSPPPHHHPSPTTTPAPHRPTTAPPPPHHTHHTHHSPSARYNRDDMAGMMAGMEDEYGGMGMDPYGGESRDEWTRDT